MMEWKELSEFLNFEQPTPYLVKTTEYDDTYETPVLTAGQSLLLGYTNETDGVYQASKESPCIIFDDFTTSFHWIDYNFKVKSSAIKMLKPKENTIFRYVYYAMQQIRFVPQQHQRHWISKYSHFQIPIPSIEEQNRIVDILDAFTDSIENLKHQIAQRRKQYEYYRDQLYLFDGRKDVEYKTLADIGTFTRGKRFVRADNVEQGVPCIHYGDMYTKYKLIETETQTHLTEEKAKKLRFAHKGDVVIVAAGENDWDIGVGMVWMGEEAAAVHDACYIFEHKQNPLYLAYYMRTYQYHHQIQKGVVDGKICSISALELGRTIIPLPSLEEQSRIVSIFDQFESSISNLEMQLALRQKQYEYYRNKLLTFE